MSVLRQMDVTTFNFRAALALVRKFLPDASFVSFDLEFTGLGKFRPSQLDTPQIRYSQARADAEEFAPIQFGLTLFRRQGNGWEAIPFNFNLCPGAVYYPSRARYPMIDRRFSMQASAISFLLQHGFDFDKCLRLGVSWLSKNLENEVKKHVEADIRLRREKDPTETIPVAGEQSFILNLAKRVTEFVSDAESQPQDPNKQVAILPLPPAPQNRLAVFRYVRMNFPCIVAKPISTLEGVRLHLRFYQTSEAATVGREEALLDDVDDFATSAASFRYIVDLLVDEQVAIVVHNGLMDVTKLYANFIGPLPETLHGFKHMFRKAFPVLYDTKLLAEQLAPHDESIRDALVGKRKQLGEIVSVLRGSLKTRGLLPDFRTFVPTARVGDIGRLSQTHVTSEGFSVMEGEQWDSRKDLYGFGRYAEDEFGHEAGYDAMQTGFLFALLRTSLGDDVHANTVFSAMEGRISLASCGGYQWVDFKNLEECEENDWFKQTAIIASSQSIIAPGVLKPRCILEKILERTKFDAANSRIITADHDTFIAILKQTDKAGASEYGMDKLIANSKQIGFETRPYRLESLPTFHGTGSQHKKRKFC